MSNTYRVEVTVMGETPQVVERFVGKILIGGWHAHGDCLDNFWDDMRIYTRREEGGPWLSYQTSGEVMLPQYTPDRMTLAIRHPEHYPGIEVGLPTGPIAFLAGDVTWKPPYQWAKLLID